MIRFIITIKDIGPRKIIKRILRNFFYLFEKYLPESILIKIFSLNKQIPEFRKIDKWPVYLLQKKSNKFKSLQFNFINKKHKLTYPLKWNYPMIPRLWIFKLHSFDWAREFLEKKYIHKINVELNYPIEEIIDSWILENKIGLHDGWHSYTLSLRIRNWIWIFISLPKLITNERVKSLWIQIKWLDLHKEDYLGGNHLLENLITLCLCSQFFNSKEATIIYEKNLKVLKKELKIQILDDGGHEERTASYHILILDRLIELAYIILIFKNEKPTWLIKVITLMNKWTNKIKLKNGRFPRFNDSPIDGCPNIDSVINFANAYLYGIKFKDKSLRDNFIKVSKNNPTNKPKSIYKNMKMEDLSNTGWTIIRPNNIHEIIFKCGKPCPGHLPPHVHSDLLSFDLSKDGEYIFAEAGTSTYSEKKIREYERSGAAHNVLQLAPIKNISKKENISYIEPVDIWGNFRAGRKAKIIQKQLGRYDKDIFSLKGEHDGFRKYGASHVRSIKIIRINSLEIQFELLDLIKCQNPMFIRQWWHLGPKAPKKYLSIIKSQLTFQNSLSGKILNNEIAEGFGIREKRFSLCIEGIIPHGEHKLYAKLIL